MDGKIKENKITAAKNLVSKTISWYLENKIAYFKKSYIPDNANESDVFFESMDNIDFYGLCDGKYISFEVKETRSIYFSLSQIKTQQLDSLQKIKNFGGISFVMINFAVKKDDIWIIGIDRLMQLKNNRVKRINVNEIQAFGINLNVEYPGIIDWVKHCKNI